MNSADLTTELRAARPVAGDALRERVRAIAATQPNRRPSPFARFSPRRLVLVAVPAVAVIVAAVAGVTALVDSEPGHRLADTPLASESATVAQDSALAPVEKAAAGGAAGTTTAPAPTQDRAQRYSAQLTIAVKDNDALSTATQSALTTARRLGGYVVSVQYATAETGAASMTLRVPTAHVQDALVSLSGLGTIEAQQVQIDDLQGQVDELGKREAALRERIARLSARIAAPGIDAETKATLVARRDAARSELAQVRAQSTQVTGEARFATIQLQLQTEQGSAVPPVPSRFDGALDQAVHVLEWEGVAVLYALVVAGPVALVALLAWLAHRLVRRRENERLLRAH
jgi:DNA uptake protein ComE-like DNA-binding protein